MADNNDSDTFSSSLGANHNNIHPLDFGKLLHGCEHYRRRCKIRAPCCNQIFFCRHCHKDSMGAFHEIVRQDIKQVICAICNTEQEVSQICTNCGVKMGEYFCGICKFYDDDISKEQFHCDNCGICRVGGGANFFHCQKCGACWEIQSCDTHVCVENAMKDHCPICYEYLFDCMKSTTIMNCGHIMHVDCCNEMINQNLYRCPICTKSFADMVTPWSLFLKESEATPEEYRYETDLELKSVPSLQVESTTCGYIHQSMASSSSNSPQASSQSWKYDVFLSFRGEDTRKTFVDHLYSALGQKLVRVYKDDEALLRGDSIAPSLLKAIEVSRIVVIVFSKNYADSSWCLDELAYIMKCRDEVGLIVMPIFYDVDPSQVRKQEGNFGEAFAKQEAKNITKAELWRKSLFDASNIAGWEPKHIANGHETKVIKEIVNKIQDRLFPLYSDVDEELVGMRKRLQDLISKLEIGTGGVQMVGIWGIGGSGKTTLAFSVYTEISRHFEGHCFIANIREKSKHGLETLQQKLLFTLLKREVEAQSVQEGKRIIKSRLCNSKVLVILDDVDYLDQLEALAGSPKWFGSGSRIIITTRDEHLLRTHRVDHVSSVKLLSDEEAILLFNKHAFNETKPLIDYERLSSLVISYAAGLPLALKVLGSFLFDTDKEEWISTLAKLEDIPNIEVMDILRISYDGLETLQKELFLDIACFFRWKNIDDTMEILDACGFHPVIGIKVLRQKALITTTDGKFDMHDLVQEMAQYIVRGKHPKNPEKHSRVWKNEEISNMCYGNSTVENDKIEAMRYYGHSSRLFEFISNMKKLRWLSVVMYLDDRDNHTEGPSFLSNELRCLYWERYPACPFPDRFQPMKLVVLKLHYSLQEALWNGCKCLPHLKVLELCFMSNLLRTPDFNGLPYLQKLKIFHCDKLEEIHPSHGNHTSLEYVSVRFCEKLRMFSMNVQMKNLKILELPKIKSNPSGECYTQPETVVHQFTRKMNLSSLQKLDLSGWGLKDGEIPFGIGELSHLEELDLSRNDFSLLGFSLSQLTRLKILILSECKWLVELPELPSSIAVLEADNCDSLTTIGNNGHTNFKCLWEVSLLRKSLGIVNDARRIVESMLQGMGIENLYMVICARLIKTTKVFPVIIMNKCTMQLPKNWCNDFCGFIMCFFTKSSTPLSYTIRMEKAMKDMMIFCPKHDLPFKKSIGRGRTRVGFVSFASLRHTSWWEEIHNTRFVSFEDALQHKEFGIALVPKKSRIAPTETSTDFHAFPRLNILDDSASTLMIEISFYSNDKSGKFVSNTLIKRKSIES